MIVDRYLIAMAEHQRRAIQEVTHSALSDDDKAHEIERMRVGVAVMMGEVLAGTTAPIFEAFIGRIRTNWLEADSSIRTRLLMNQLTDPEENKKHVNR